MFVLKHLIITKEVLLFPEFSKRYTGTKLVNNFIKSVTSCGLENVHNMFNSSLPILKHLTLITTILNY